MHVASKIRLPSPATLMREPLLMRHPAGLCPAVDHYWAIIPTQWGPCAALWKYHVDKTSSDFAEKPRHALLCRIIPPGLPVHELRRDVMKQCPLCNEVFGDVHGNFHPEVVPDWFVELVRYLQSYYANSLHDCSDLRVVEHWAYWQPRLDWSQVSPFCKQVLETTARIQRGRVLTYGQIARQLGKPNASRAVGAALGSNPWPVLIPCHRVMGASGRLTGFSAPGGVKAKQRMLDMESLQASLF